MNIILLFDRAICKIQREYRKYVFRKKIGCEHKDFSLVGKVTLINRNVRLGHHVTIYPDVMLFGDGRIDIGDNVDIGNGTLLYASKCWGITIGKNTLIAAQSYIIDTDHGMSSEDLIRNQKNTVASVTIGEDVWIAAGCKILRGAQIHDGAVIGAASLVKGEIPSNAIAVGVPAKVIKHREIK